MMTGAMALASVTCAPPAQAQTKQQIDACELKNSPTNEQQIDGCTAMIQSNWYSGQSLAAAFYNRANAYSRKGNSTAPSGTTTRRSSSIQALPAPSTIAATRTATKAKLTAPFRTSTRRSGSIQGVPSPSAVEVSPKPEGDKAGAAADMAQARRINPDIK